MEIQLNAGVDHGLQQHCVSGPTTAHGWGDKSIGFRSRPGCGCVTYWRSAMPREDGRRRIAVNLRLTELDPMAHLPLKHFDGLVKFEDLPRDGRCVTDLWF